MYSLVRELGWKTALIGELPYLLMALVIAEQFYKWRSFTLELIGFLVTWFILSAVGSALVSAFSRR